MKNFLKKFVSTLLNLLPLKNYILFESNPDLSDNTYAYYQYLINKGYNKKYKFIWLVNNYKKISIFKDNNVEFVDRHSSKITTKLYKHYLLSVSKYIIDCNVFIKPARKSQIRIHMTHGMPIKYSEEYCGMAGRIDVLLSTSDFFNEQFSEWFITKQDNIVSSGYPRNDVLLNDSNNLKTSLFADKKVIIWMPTYRQHNKNVNVKTETFFPLGVPVLHCDEDFIYIDRILKDNNCYLLLRLHPAQDLSKINISEYDNIFIADDNYLLKNNVELYTLLSCTDALITDYSSVYYDYMLLDKPIGLMTEDSEEFFSVFKCAYDNFEDNIVGEYIYTKEQFCEFIENVSSENDTKFEERTRKKLLYHNYITGSSCERLFNFMKEKYDF